MYQKSFNSQKKGSGNKLTIEDIIDKMSAWTSYWSNNNALYRMCNEFINGEQWDATTKDYYVKSKKPCLTINLLYLFVKQVVAEQIQNLPELQVIPKNMKIEQDNVDLLQDLIRTIFVNSNGEEAIKKAGRQALMAFSVLKVNTRYCDSDSFQQEIYFQVKDDPTLCGFDPAATEKEKLDGAYCYDVYYVTKEQFETDYPDEVFTTGDFEGIGPNYGWGSWGDNAQETCALMDFYYKETYVKKLCKVSPTISGEKFDTIEEKDFDKYVKQYYAMSEEKRQIAETYGEIYFTPPAPKIIERRKAKDYKIKCYRCRNDKILETYDWPGKFLPMVYVDGDSIIDNGKQICKSFTNEAHDLQRSINMIWSDIVQMIKTARRERILATAGMVGENEEQFRNPESNYGVMLYEVDNLAANTPGGGAPQIIAPTPVPMEFISQLQWAVQTLMNMLGRTEAAMGVNPNGIQSQPTSGKAFEKMVMQQNLSAYIQFDNLLDATAKIGQSVLDLIPKTYSDEQYMTIYDKDMSPKTIYLNGFNEDNNETENEVKEIKAQVVLSPAPSFEMQKQMERDYMLQLFQAGATNPELFSILGWQLAQLSETSITPEVVKVLKTLVPPNVLAAIENKPAPPPQPNPQMMLAQQELQQRQMENQLKAQQIQSDNQKNQIDYLQSLIDMQKNNVKSNAEIQKAQLQVQQAAIDTKQKALEAHHKGVSGIMNLATQAMKVKAQDQANKQQNETN